MLKIYSSWLTPHTKPSTKWKSQAQWDASTDVKPEHDAAAEVAGKARAAFTGNPALIREAQELLKQKEGLEPIARRRARAGVLNAAEGSTKTPNWSRRVLKPRRSRPPR